MAQCVAFLRAINTGRRRVKMAVLREIAESLDELHDVSTVLASGNVVFRTATAPDADLERRLEEAFADGLGFPAETFIRTAEELRAIASAPLRERDAFADSVLEVAFLRASPSPAVAAAVASLSAPPEWVAVHGRELWWRRLPMTQSAIGGKRLERTLQGPMTARSIDTIQRLVDGPLSGDPVV